MTTNVILQCPIPVKLLLLDVYVDMTRHIKTMAMTSLAHVQDPCMKL